MSGVLCVYRAERFSPNSVDRDRAVMDAVALLLAGRGIAVKTVGEEQLRPDREDAVVLTMARSAATYWSGWRRKAVRLSTLLGA